jgi:putative oxidoreductase
MPQIKESPRSPLLSLKNLPFEQVPSVDLPAGLLAGLPQTKLNDIGILLLRLSTGATMILAHGVPKIAGFSAHSAQFPDPLGVGASASMIMAILGETGFSLAILLGLQVRAAAAGLFTTMSIIFWLVHRNDPWDYKELSLVYALICLTLILTGGGKYTLESWIKRRLKLSI